MARFYGDIGFGDTVETKPGVWEGVITERKLYGGVLRNTYRSTTSDKVNDDVELSNTISVVGTKYAFEHVKDIRYIKFDGNYWVVDSVELQRPRLILSLGGVYNGPKAAAPGSA